MKVAKGQPECSHAELAAWRAAALARSIARRTPKAENFTTVKDSICVYMAVNFMAFHVWGEPRWRDVKTDPPGP